MLGCPVFESIFHESKEKRKGTCKELYEDTDRRTVSLGECQGTKTRIGSSSRDKARWDGTKNNQDLKVPANNCAGC